MNGGQQHAKNAPLDALTHCGIDIDAGDQYAADAIPGVHSETVARWIMLAYRAGQGALADDIRLLKWKVAALEHTDPDHGAPLAVDFNALREIAEKRNGR